MARVLALILVSSVATDVFEVFDNRTLSIEYHRRLAVIPHGKAREMGAVTWKVGRLARRLTTSSSSVSAECETACKDSFEPFEADFKAIETALKAVPDVDKPKHLGNTMACMYQALCHHKGAFTCLASEAACKDAITVSDQDSSDTSLASLNSQMNCLCDDCPEMIQGMAGMMQAFADVINQALTQSGQEDAEAAANKMKKDLLDGICPLVPAIECAEEKASCNTDNPAMEGVLGAFKEGNDTQEDEVKKLKEGCQAEGATMALPETDKYSCDNIPGLDIDVTSDLAAPGVASAGVATLAVVALAVLS